MGLHLLIVLVCLRVTFIYPVPIYTKDILNHTCFHPWQPSHLKHEPTNVQRISPISPILVVHVFSSCQDMGHQNRGNRDPLMVLALHPGKTLRGSLFPLLPLRVKCQNHERVPISPISPILVVYVFSSCQDMDHQNRGNRDPLMVLALHPGKTLRGSLFPLLPLRVKCQNHERVPISPISPILVAYVFSSCQDMDHQNRGNRGNRDPLMVLAFHP